jgi:nitrogenase subunit NifH
MNIRFTPIAPADISPTMSGLSFLQKSEAVSNVTAKDLELLVQDQAFIDGCWVKKDQTFNVYGSSLTSTVITIYETHLIIHQTHPRHRSSGL